MIKGVSQMFSREGTPKGYAYYSKNIIINQTLDEIINEKGTSLITALSTASIKDLIGLISHGNQIIIFYVDTNDSHIISVYDEDANTFTVKLTRTDLDFNSSFPITGKAKLNSKGELIVAFTDNNVSPKYINLDTATSADDLSLYNLSLLAANPHITFEVVEGGGSLKTGVHFLVLQYEDINKNASNYSPLSPPVYIVGHNDLEAFSNTEGTVAGQVSNKGIKFTVADVDTSFKKLRATLITKIDDTVTVNTYKVIEITSSTMTFTITGSELPITLTTDEVLTLNQIFTKVRHLEVLNDQLFVAEFSIPEQVDYQNIANRIKLEWTSNPIFNPVTDQSSSTPYRKSGNNKKTFIHDEVYALYAQFELNDDTLTQWFHIPGREVTASHRAVSSIANGIKFNGSIPKLFQLQCTAELGSIIGSMSVDGTTNYAYGEFGVWENEDETYPSNFPDYAGEKVRHHKFPSLEWLRTNVYNSGAALTSYMVNMWDMLGIKHSITTTDLDTALLVNIRSIRIGYAKRDTTNMSILGYDIVQLAANPELSGGTFDTGKVTSTGGNWKIVASGTANDILPTNDYIRLHSPDVMILKPNISDIYLYNQLTLKRTGMNNSFFTLTDKPYGRIFYGGQGSLHGGPLVDIDIWSYLTNFMSADVLEAYDDTKKFNPLTLTRYIAPNTTFSANGLGFDNSLNEECLFGKPTVPLEIDIAGATSDSALKMEQGVATESPNLYEETILTAIKSPRTNFFLSYVDQVIVPINGRIDPNSADGRISGDGDAFICVHSFVTMASAPMVADEVFNLTEDDGVRCIKVFLCESRYNLNQRYSTLTDYNTYFFPVATPTISSLDSFWIFELNQLNCPVNNIQISKSFNALNDFEQYGIFDHTAVYQHELPYAIGRSLIASRSTDFEDGWRQFRPNDIFYTIRNKGKITNLVAWGTDKLLIHHERALLRTRDKAVLQTDITNISLGSGDLFTLEPEEIVPTQDGFGGTQHKFGCVLCEAGYAFIDKDAGEILIYKDGENYKNIGGGFKNLFADMLRDITVGDNPYNTASTSLSLAFNKRIFSLILSLKADSIQFTAAFDLIKGEWVGAKDYLPEGMVSTKKNLYSFKNKNFYRHNTGVYGDFYGTIYPSFVDIIINDEPDTEKILAALEWVTKVESGGVVKPNETITSITIWNDSFCTGQITINALTNIADYENKNSKNPDRTWRFNKIEDVVKDVSLPFVGGLSDDYRPISSNIATDLAWFEKAEVRGKYFIVRLEYSNIEDKLVSLRTVVPNIKRSSS